MNYFVKFCFLILVTVVNSCWGTENSDSFQEKISTISRNKNTMSIYCEWTKDKSYKLCTKALSHHRFSILSLICIGVFLQRDNIAEYLWYLVKKEATPCEVRKPRIGSGSNIISCSSELKFGS